MRVVLRVNAGRNAGQEIPIRVQRFLIGRADDCHLRASSTQVSRYHCAIFVEDEQVWVRDYGSRNGTLVDGNRVTERRRLRNGDQLEVGPLHFLVLLEEGADTAKPVSSEPGHDTQSAMAGETSLPGKLKTTLRVIGQQQVPTQEGDILEILAEPIEPQKEPLPPELTDPIVSAPPEEPPEEPKTPPKPKPSFRPAEKDNPADAAVDGLKRLFRPKKQ